MFDLYKDNRDAALGFLAGNISPGKPLNFGESIENAWTANGAYQMSVSKENTRTDIIGGYLEAYRQTTGEDLNQTNTLTPDGLVDTGVTFALPSPADMRQRYEQTRAQRPDLKLAPFPDDQQIEAMTIEKMRAARIHYDEMQARGGSGLGDFLGTAASSLRDPVNMASMAFGAGAASGVLRTALIEGGINMGSQAAVVASTYETRRKIDPNYTFDQAMYEVAAAGIGGAVIGGTLKGLVRLFDGVDRAKLPREVNDALNVANAEVKVADSNPIIGGGAIDAAKHKELVDFLSRDLASHNRPVEVSDVLARYENQSQAMDPTAPMAPGATARRFDANNNYVDVTYKVVEASSLVTSHGDDFTANPAYPQVLQPRDRSRAASVEQVNTIANGIIPERLGPNPDAGNGAPIIGPGGVVESGNARVMGLRKAYQLGKAEDYRGFLQAQGFDVTGIKEPVLVSERVSQLTDAQLQEFTGASNRATVARMSTVETARSDARLLNEETLSALAPDDITSAANRDFTSKFVRQLPIGERAAFYADGGTLSVDGVRRIQAALLARAYEDPGVLGRMLEDPDSNIRAIGSALTDAAPSWARLRDDVAAGVIPQSLDITREVLAAVRLVMRSRDERVPLLMLVDQADMLGGGPSPMTRAILDGMFKDPDLTKPASRAAVADLLNTYADQARKVVPGLDMFGQAPLSAGEILQAAVKKATGRDVVAPVDIGVPTAIAQVDVQPLKAAAPAISDIPPGVVQAGLTETAIREAAASPETAKAAEKLAQDLADKAADEGRMLFTHLDDASKPIPLAQALKEIGDEESLAAEIGACAIGNAGEAAA